MAVNAKLSAERIKEILEETYSLGPISTELICELVEHSKAQDVEIVELRAELDALRPLMMGNAGAFSPRHRKDHRFYGAACVEDDCVALAPPIESK